MEWDSLIPANQNGYDIVKYVFIVWCLIDLCIPGVDPGFYKSRKARRHKKSLVGTGVCSRELFEFLAVCNVGFQHFRLVLSEVDNRG